MKQLNEIGNACSFIEGVWICTENGDGCRHGHDVATGCLFKCNKYCTCSRAMADAYGLLKQTYEQVINEVTNNNQPLSAKILRHIADLHEAGIVPSHVNVNEEWDKHMSSGKFTGEADFHIACISYGAFDMACLLSRSLPAAIAKNERRLAWIRQHPDPTKTPIELWEEAKRAKKDGENEHE